MTENQANSGDVDWRESHMARGAHLEHRGRLLDSTSRLPCDDWQRWLCCRWSASKFLSNDILAELEGSCKQSALVQESWRASKESLWLVVTAMARLPLSSSISARESGKLFPTCRQGARRLFPTLEGGRGNIRWSWAATWATRFTC